MNSSPKPPTMPSERVAEPLVGAMSRRLRCREKGDLSDWVELMEAGEALCPVWPERDKKLNQGDWRL